MENFSKLIDAFAHLAGALAWPSVVVFIVYRFGPSIGDFIKNFQEGSLKAFGFEASAKRVVANIDAALKHKSHASTDKPEKITIAGADQKAKIAEIVTPEAFKQALGRRILWVDDKPEGNEYEIKALRELGYSIKTVISSEDAIDIINNGPSFDLIISDLGRPEGPEAGFDLLLKLKEMGISIPYIIYTSLMKGVNREDFRSKAKNRGAFGITNNASNLTRLVIQATKYLSDIK